MKIQCPKCLSINKTIHDELNFNQIYETKCYNCNKDLFYVYKLDVLSSNDKNSLKGLINNDS